MKRKIFDMPCGGIIDTRNEGKWIRFRRIPKPALRKTEHWEVIAKEGGNRLGAIIWYCPWRCYVFTPEWLTVFEHDCLRDIADFVERQTKAQRATWKKRKSGASNE